MSLLQHTIRTCKNMCNGKFPYIKHKKTHLSRIINFESAVLLKLVIPKCQHN